MTSHAIVRKRRMMWVTVGLTLAYALIMALALPPSSHSPSKVDDLLFMEGLFAGPMMITCILSALLARIEARTILVGFAVGYSILSALIVYWTFGFEHDAQYQLMLLFIPVIGFLGIVAAGLAAAMIR